MKIENLRINGEKLHFKIKDADLAFVNALRRTCIESVPILAIDEVEFVKNDSVLYDEILAHRLGLVPLRADLRSIKMRDECTCQGKGCNKCTIKLKLSVKGREVLSTDLKSSAVEIPYGMPIAKLMPEQELELVASARLGIGKEHAKFIPGLIWHDYEDESEINFNIESWGQLKPEEIFISAAVEFTKKLKELDKAADKL